MCLQNETIELHLPEQQHPVEAGRLDGVAWHGDMELACILALSDSSPKHIL